MDVIRNDEKVEIVLNRPKEERRLNFDKNEMAFYADFSILNTFKLKPMLKSRQHCHLVTREKSLILSDQSEKPITTEHQVYI